MDDLNRMLEARAAIVAEMRSTEPVLHVLGLLELIELSYKERLVDVTAEDLAKTQGALKQVKLLHQAISGAQGVVPLL
jgi:hypothetical protein